ncbi:MAG TPA: UDP-N-acetylmuramoyl-L-alanyl-D-glutamate--2,6-diaminopimelate ligase [Vicinamibacteria bacterium]|nr:UDP-N-acetylmuramoyl-L-alanyl-D-glutamate--2,6-diaminopimelate ligase [Vicinamibacteria bacterium]
MRLDALSARVPGGVLSGDGAVEVTAVTHDSRRAGPGTLFVAVRGTATDGNRFVPAAWKAGAAAVASENPPPSADRPWLQVPDARAALADLSAAVLGDPARAMTLVGVTGTNGKTTTTYLIDAALRASGASTGLVGTIQYRVGGRLAEAVRTTPESSDLQQLLREMRDAGCTHVVMEVSSHSLVLKRVRGIRYRVAVFTNLTRDHLDFHGDMDAYFAAKRLLFEEHLDPAGRAVINADDDRAGELRAASRAPVWTFGIDEPADFRAEDVRLSLSASRFRLASPFGAHEVEAPLLGAFNVQNLLAAIAAACALGIPVETAIAGVTSVTGVPGRLERVDAGQPFTVVVDYAHTDDALKNLLETVRELGPRRVLTVFGCGGDRDRTKRPLMGAVASRLSDVVIVTSDNPRSEPPEAILEEIQRGMNGGRGAERHAIVDRREAIGRALEMAAAGDAVVIAGKGHETYQQLRDRTVPFDDRQVAREILSRAGLRGGRR